MGVAATLPELSEWTLNVILLLLSQTIESSPRYYRWLNCRETLSIILFQKVFTFTPFVPHLPCLF